MYSRTVYDPDGNATRFHFTGDPVLGTGWIFERASDIRSIHSAGPFSMALGDTQEVVVALVGGMRYDNLVSIQQMKLHDRINKYFFDRFHELDSIPKPALEAFGDDRAIVLNWGNNNSLVQEIEDFNRGGFVFEGYEIYQFPESDSELEDGRCIAVFDIENNIKAVTNEDVVPYYHEKSFIAAHDGGDNGIEHYLRIEHDHILDRPISNDRPFHYGIRAYYYLDDSDAPVRAIASDLVRSTVYPQMTVEVDNNSEFGTSIEYIKDGRGDIHLELTVIDPSVSTSHDYSIDFQRDPTTLQISWAITNQTTGQFILQKSFLHQSPTDVFGSADETRSTIVDGHKINLSYQGSAIKDYTEYSIHQEQYWGWRHRIVTPDIAKHHYSHSFDNNQYIILSPSGLNES